MAFASTIDTRPHVMGDMVLITGTYDGDDGGAVAAGTIDLSSLLSTIIAAGGNGDLPGTAGTTTTNVILSAAAPTTVTLDFVSGTTGSWWALGRRS